MGAALSPNEYLSTIQHGGLEMRRMIWLAPMMALVSTGCANFSPLTRTKELRPGSSYWLTYDTTRRGAYLFVGQDGRMHSCAEPAPDTGYSFTQNAGVDVAAPSGTTVGIDAALAATLSELAGRDNLVLIAREALFRICEMRANGDLPSDQVYPAFQEIMFAIKEIAKVKQETAKATQEAAKADAAKAETETVRLKAGAK